MLEKRLHSIFNTNHLTKKSFFYLRYSLRDAQSIKIKEGFAVVTETHKISGNKEFDEK